MMIHRFLVLCLPVVCGAALTGKAAAQDHFPASTEASFPRVGLPEGRSKSTVVAAGLEYFIPTLGHAYAGDWSRGAPPALLLVAGAVVAGLGYGRCIDERGCEGLLAGVGTMAAGKVWGIWSAVRTVQMQVGVEPSIRTEGPSIYLAVSLRP